MVLQDKMWLAVLFLVLWIECLYLFQIICWSPNVMVFGSGIWEVIESWGWSPHDELSGLIRKGIDLALCLSREDTMKSKLFTSQDLPAPWSWTSQSLELWEINFCWLRHSVYFCYSFLVIAARADQDTLSFSPFGSRDPGWMCWLSPPVL